MTEKRNFEELELQPAERTAVSISRWAANKNQFEFLVTQDNEKRKSLVGFVINNKKDLKKLIDFLQHKPMRRLWPKI